MERDPQSRVGLGPTIWGKAERLVEGARDKVASKHPKAELTKSALVGDVDSSSKESPSAARAPVLWVDVESCDFASTRAGIVITRRHQRRKANECGARDCDNDHHAGVPDHLFPPSRALSSVQCIQKTVRHVAAICDLPTPYMDRSDLGYIGRQRGSDQNWQSDTEVRSTQRTRFQLRGLSEAMPTSAANRS